MARILLVDDDPVIVELLTLNLELEEHEVLVSVDGPSALRRAREEQPDLVLLDVMMPELDGFEVCARLREDPATRGLPVVILSARALQSDVERGLALGATDYVTKPFDPLDLMALIERRVGVGGATP